MQGRREVENERGGGGGGGRERREVDNERGKGEKEGMIIHSDTVQVS